MKQKNLVLMVVAVGCGLVAAFLTSQMSAKPTVEKVEVIVAAKDLPVGTQLTKEDLKTCIKRKTMSKDSLPPAIVEAEEELLERRLTRTIRAEETFNKADLTRGGVVSIPPGLSMVALPINASEAVAGFVGPGSRVDVLATVRLQNRLPALPILVNMLVLAVATNPNLPANGAYQSPSTVSFAADRQQALLIKLARSRGCELSFMLRNQDDKVTENDQNYDIDKVVKRLQDDKIPAGISDPDGDTVKPRKPDPATIVEGSTKVEMVKVPAASEDIPAGTTITSDLIAEKFKFIELPKELAAEAITDLKERNGEVLRNGLGKGQWVTKSLVGRADLKPGPREEFNPSKPGVTAKEPVVARKTREVRLTTTSGTVWYLYEEDDEGGWRLLREGRGNLKTAAQPKPAPIVPEKVD